MNRPPSNRARRSLFAAAAALLAIAAALSALTPAPARRPTPPTTSPGPSVIEAPPRPPAPVPTASSAGRSDRERTDAAARAAGLAVARAFVDAFLAYDTGGATDPHIRAALRRASDPALASQILSQAPRPVRGFAPQPGVLVSLQADTIDATDGGMPVLATVRRARRIEQLLLSLKRKDARWQVTHLGD